LDTLLLFYNSPGIGHGSGDRVQQRYAHLSLTDDRSVIGYTEGPVIYRVLYFLPLQVNGRRAVNCQKDISYTHQSDIWRLVIRGWKMRGKLKDNGRADLVI